MSEIPGDIARLAGRRGAAIINLGALVVFVFTYASSKLAQHIVDTFFGWLFHTPLVGGWIRRHVGGLAHTISHFFGRVAQFSDAQLGRSWHQLAGAFDFIGQMFLLLISLSWLTAHELAGVGNTIRKAIGLSPSVREGHVANVRTKALPKQVANVDARAKARAGAVAATAAAFVGAEVGVRTRDASYGAKARARARAREAALPETAGTTAAGTRAEIERGAFAAQRARLSTLEKLLGALGLASLVGIGLSKLDLGHLRCKSNRRVGKALCGAPLGLLEGLLGGAIEALVTIDLCRLSRIATAVAVRFEPELRALVVVVNAALCGGTRQPPPRLAFRSYTPPVASSSLAL